MHCTCHVVHAVVHIARAALATIGVPCCLPSFDTAYICCLLLCSAVDVVGATWVYRSSCSISALQGVQSIPSLPQQQQQQPGQLCELSLKYAGNPAGFPSMNSSFVSHVTQLQLNVPQTVLPHLTSLLPDKKAVIVRSSSSGSWLWNKLRTLELCLDGGVLDAGTSEQRQWAIPSHQEQQAALQWLLHGSNSLRVLRLEGSTRAGVSLLPLLAPLATAASGTLQELQLLHAVPQLHETGAIPFLREFRQLRSLTMASPAMRMKALMLQLLPPTLQQLHLEGTAVSCAVAASEASAEKYKDLQQSTARIIRETVECALKDSDTQHHVPAADAAAPAPATASSGSSEDAAAAAAAAASVAASGEYAAELMHAKHEELRAWALPRPVAQMPQLQRLHLVNCCSSTPEISLPLLLQWAGPCLLEVVIANVYTSEECFPRAASDNVPEVPLPLLRRFDWVNSSLPMAPCGQFLGLSQLLTFLQANALQLQQLKVAAGEKEPALDWHVPLLLRMPQLRRLEAYVGADAAAELAARCVLLLTVLQLNLHCLWYAHRIWWCVLQQALQCKQQASADAEVLCDE
jgi:hypothetical protein